MKKKTLTLVLEFDNVNNDILLNKRESAGIRGEALALFWTYLVNRKKVKIQYTEQITLV